MGRVTLQHVAAEAGVSAMTVSNFLSGKSTKMQAATRDRVSAAIDKLGYRPNRLARSLRTGRAQSIGVIVPSVANPFWGAFANELEKASITAGYSVLLGNTERDPNRELRYVEDLWDAGVRSIVIGTSLPSLIHLQPLLDKGLRLVTFDRPVQPNDPSSVVSVSIDNEMGGRLAAEHVIGLGHRRISFVAGSVTSLNRAARYRGFLSALELAGLEPLSVAHEHDQTRIPFDVAETAGVGRDLLIALFSQPEPPTAIVAVNDLTALGVCSGLRELGLRAGKDVSVVGFDDIVLAALWDPPLTTIHQPLAELASLALREALTENDGPSHEASVLISPELVARGSTGPPDSGSDDEGTGMARGKASREGRAA